MKKILIRTTIFLSLISLSNNILYGDVIKYPNSDVYEGNLINGVPAGHGTLTYANGDRYSGNFIDGVPAGKGELYKKVTKTNYDGISRIVFDEYNIYEGYFENGKIIKCDKLTYANGFIYDGDFIDGEPIGKGKLLRASGSIYEGDFIGGEPVGQGKYTWADGNFYEGNFKNGKLDGQGKFTIVNGATKKPLYIQTHDEKGIMKSVEYLFKKKDTNSRLVIDYDGINRALNRNEINKENKSEYLKKYIKVFDKDNDEITNHDNVENLIKQCAQYQMQGRLKGKTNELDDENRMSGGYTGLQNLIVLSQTIDNIPNLKRTRFEIQQNNPSWPTNTYDDIESYLNSLGLTKNNSSSNDNLVSIYDNNLGTNYLSINMVTTSKNHLVSGIIDLNKIKEDEEDFIYVYDSGAVIAGLSGKELGNLQLHCRLYSHRQQELDSCWYHASCSTVTAAEHPKIIEGIRNKKIESIDNMIDRYFIVDTEPNNFEVLQMIKLQKVAENLGVGRLGHKEIPFFRKIFQYIIGVSNKPRMVYHILMDDVKKAIKDQTNDEIGGVYKSLLFIAKERGLNIDDLDSEIEE